MSRTPQTARKANAMRTRIADVPRGSSWLPLAECLRLLGHHHPHWDDFKAGWQAAMHSVWGRLPMPGVGRDPMNPREVSKLLEYVKSNLPNKEGGK